MISLFSTKGSIGRLGFLACLAFYALSPALGLFAYLFFNIVTGATWHLTLTIAIMVAFYCIGDRIFSCAYIKRARAIGVEIESPWIVYYYFMGFERGATIRDILLKRR